MTDENHKAQEPHGGLTVKRPTPITLLATLTMLFIAPAWAQAPLGVASIRGELGEMQRLIAEGASLDEVDDFGRTPLMWAVSGKSNPLAAVRLLLNAGADVNARGSNQATALLEAVTAEAPLEVIQALVEAGADPNIRSRIFGTPLQAAAENGNSPQAFSLLLAAGGDPTIRNHNGKTVWELAAGNPALGHLIPSSNWHLDAYSEIVHAIFGHLGVVITDCPLDGPRMVCGKTNANFDLFRTSWDYYLSHVVDTPVFFTPREAWKAASDSYGRLYNWEGGRTFLVMYWDGDILIDLTDY